MGQRNLGKSMRLRDNVLKAGDIVRGHGHNFEHVTYIPKGHVKVRLLDVPNPDDLFTDRLGSIHLKEGAKTTVAKEVEKKATDGYNFIVIDAGKIHEIEAVEDSIIHCLYPHRNALGEIVPEDDGWMKSYV